MNKYYIIFLFIVCTAFASSAQQNGFESKEKTSTSKVVVPNIVNTINGLTASNKQLPQSLSYNLTEREDISNKEFRSMLIRKDDLGQVHFFEGQLKDNSEYRRGSTVNVRAKAYMNAYLSIDKKDHAGIDFIEKEVLQSESESHVRMEQRYKNIPIFGKEIVVHFKNSNANSWNGQIVDTEFSLETKPILKSNDALKIAQSHLKDHHGKHVVDFAKDGQLNYSDDQERLVIFEAKDEMKLAYHLTVRPDFMHRFEYFVDAHNGEILNHFDHTCSFAGPATATAKDLFNVTQAINTFEDGGTYYLLDGSRPMFVGNIDNFDGAILTLDMKNDSYESGSYSAVTSGNNSWNNPTAISAHVNGAKAYEYFINTHGRNSINGKGGNIVSFINVAEDDFGTGFDNAFWNGTAIFYGNGRNQFKPLARGLDVAGHEMSHGVISNSANLTYQGESGAINESMADVFGSMIDREDWLIGEDVVKVSAFPSGALRSMIDPHNGGNSLNDNGYQPRHYSERYTGSEDNGGVHINSGIPNHAFYRIATSVGKAKAEKIYYRALTVYLTASSRFVDLRLAVEKSASDLYGSTELEVVKSAFDAVGIAGGSGGNYEEDIVVNTGDDFILSVDINNNDPNTLYLSPSDISGFIPVSQRGLNRKQSVTDDGSEVYFVGTDNHIYRIDLTSSNFSETKISNSAIWDNVAVSKDGGKIAAITTEVDSSIYIFDLRDGSGVRYRLYNPTFTEGVNGGGQPLYADALEWDYTGQFVMYDAYNLIDNESGDNFDYWDVGFIQAWNNQQNNFGNGSISKLFSSLPEGISIGNPSFSKNSPYIVAFDEINEFESPTSYSLIAANIERNKVVTVYNNTELSYPNYSLNDQQIIFNGRGTSGTQVVGIINMQGDKITPGVNPPVVHIQDAIWGVWFGVGDRVLPTAIESNESAHDVFTITPNVVQDILHVNLKVTNIEFSASLISVDGKTLRTSLINPLDRTMEWDVSDLSTGSYFLQLNDGEKVYARKFVKE